MSSLIKGSFSFSFFHLQISVSRRDFPHSGPSISFYPPLKYCLICLNSIVQQLQDKDHAYPTEKSRAVRCAVQVLALRLPSLAVIGLLSSRGFEWVVTYNCGRPNIYFILASPDSLTETARPQLQIGQVRGSRKVYTKRDDETKANN